MTQVYKLYFIISELNVVSHRYLLEQYLRYQEKQMVLIEKKA